MNHGMSNFMPQRYAFYDSASYSMPKSTQSNNNLTQNAFNSSMQLAAAQNGNKLKSNI